MFDKLKQPIQVLPDIVRGQRPSGEVYIGRFRVKELNWKVPAALDDSDLNVKAYAVWALGRIHDVGGDSKKDARPQLEEYMQRLFLTKLNPNRASRQYLWFQGKGLESVLLILPSIVLYSQAVNVWQANVFKVFPNDGLELVGVGGMIVERDGVYVYRRLRLQGWSGRSWPSGTWQSFLQTFGFKQCALIQRCDSIQR